VLFRSLGGEGEKVLSDIE